MFAASFELIVSISTCATMVFRSLDGCRSSPPDEVGQVQDTSVGAELLSMARHFVGYPAFRAGMKSKLRGHRKKRVPVSWCISLPCLEVQMDPQLNLTGAVRDGAGDL